MGTFEKDLQKICQNPKNVRLQTLIKVLENLRFEHREKKHHVFVHQGNIWTVSAHGRNPLLKETYVKRICAYLRENDLIDEEDWQEK